MTDQQQHPEQPEPRTEAEQKAELMWPITSGIFAALEGFWGQQDTRQLQRFVDMLATNCDVALIVQYGPSGISVDIAKPVDIPAAPESGTGQYL